MTTDGGQLFLSYDDTVLGNTDHIVVGTLDLSALIVVRGIAEAGVSSQRDGDPVRSTTVEKMVLAD